MKDQIRAFIALQLHVNIQDALAEVQEELKTSHSDVKWTDPNKLHITLKFLGDVPNDRAPKVKTALEGIAATTAPFSIKLNKLGCFPDMNDPKVVWIGIENGAKEVSTIAGQVEVAMSALGFKKEERDFRCHVTLGRVRGSLGKGLLIATMKETSVPMGLIQTIDTIALYQSELSPKGPIYSALHKARLEG